MIGAFAGVNADHLLDMDAAGLPGDRMAYSHFLSHFSAIFTSRQTMRDLEEGWRFRVRQLLHFF